MKFGYWMPVFGGWLRNISDEGMEASWDYVRRLAQRSEQTGWDLSLIAVPTTGWSTFSNERSLRRKS